MRKILMSLVMVLATATMVAGATQAVFSDSSVFAENTLATAKVDIDARSEAAGGTLGKPLVVTGLVPGQYSDWARGVVYNQADSTPVRVFMYVSNIQGGSVCDKTNLTVYTGHANSGNASERQFVLYNSGLQGLSGPGNRVEVTGPGKVFNPTLPANTSAVIQQQAQLDSSADNAQSNATCTWDEVFVGETPTT